MEYMPINSLRPNPANPKDHHLGELSVSMDRFGYVEPIVIDERTEQLIAGHGRVEALQKMRAAKKPAPQGVDVDGDEWLVPVVRGWASKDDAEASAMLIASNQLTIAGGWNDAKLADMLTVLSQENALAGTGFDSDDLDNLIAQLNAEQNAAGGDTDAELEEPEEEKQEFIIFSMERVLEESFRWYRENGFPYRKMPLHMQLQEMNRLAALDQDAALRSNAAYKVADSYHPHRFHGHANGMRSPVEAFEKDEDLKRAIRLVLENGASIKDEYFGTLSLVAGTQACSNFRPAFAMHLYRRFCVEGGIVIDPSTGYGGRLTGWIGSKLGGRYVGVDPSTKTHAGNTALAAQLAPADSVTLINKPFEDVEWKSTGLIGKADFAFTSPPYFSKELYAQEATQSFMRYKTFEDWRDGFLAKVMSGVFALLKPGRTCVINIADVKIADKVYPLEQATVDLGKKAGFTHQETLRFEMTRRFGKGNDEEVATEPAFVFIKPAG